MTITCTKRNVTPEAMNGGPIAVVKDGDIIKIDIPNRRLDLEIEPEELQRRLSLWSPPKSKAEKGILATYSKTVKATSKGATYLL